MGVGRSRCRNPLDITANHVPDGVSAQDHLARMTSLLDKAGSGPRAVGDADHDRPVAGVVCSGLGPVTKDTLKGTAAFVEDMSVRKVGGDIRR